MRWRGSSVYHFTSIHICCCVCVCRFLHLAPFDDKYVWRQQVEKGVGFMHINLIWNEQLYTSNVQYVCCVQLAHVAYVCVHCTPCAHTYIRTFGVFCTVILYTYKTHIVYS